MSHTSKLVLKVVSITFSILITILVILGVVNAAEWSYGFGYRVFTEEAVDRAPGIDKSVTISGEMSAKQIGELLEEKGLIRDANLFVAQLKLSAYSDKMKAGTYTLNTSMTAKDMMQIMSAEEDTEETETE